LGETNRHLFEFDPLDLLSSGRELSPSKHLTEFIRIGVPKHLKLEPDDLLAEGDGNSPSIAA
jgi:hypothetical protein